MLQCQPLGGGTLQASGLHIFFKVEYDLFDLADRTSEICFCRSFPFLIPPFHFSNFILQNSVPLDILYKSIPQRVSTIWEPFPTFFPFLSLYLMKFQKICPNLTSFTTSSPCRQFFTYFNTTLFFITIYMYLIHTHTHTVCIFKTST